MIFVFGITLLIIGVPLGFYKEQEVTYSYLYGVRIPSGVKDVYPFQPLAVLLAFVGFILIIWGIYITNKETNQKIQEIATLDIIFCSSCGQSILKEAKYCSKCGKNQ